MTDFLALFKEPWSKLDPDTAAILARIYTTAANEAPIFTRTPEGARDLINRFLPFYVSAGAPAIAHIEERRIPAASGEIRVRLYDPGTPAPGPAIVFLHGGGFVVCDIDVYDGVARQLAKRSGMRVVSVDYALAPGASVPGPAERLHRRDPLGRIAWRGLGDRSHAHRCRRAIPRAPISRLRRRSHCAMPAIPPCAGPPVSMAATRPI